MTKATKAIVQAVEKSAYAAYYAEEYAKASSAYDHASRMYMTEYRMSGKVNMLDAANGCAEMARKMDALS